MEKRSAAKPSAPHHRIVSLEVSAGFFEEVNLEFEDGLNCIIGGRGTGKTTILELIRFGLGQEPNEKTAPDLAKAFKGVVRANLEDGRVRLRIRTKDGVEYRVERAWGEEPQVFDEKRRPVPITFESDLLFHADVYSQNEIEDIATDSGLQLALLDKFVDGSLLRRIGADTKRVDRLLRENAGRLVALDREISDLEENVAELPALAEKLKGYLGTNSPDALKIDEAHRSKALREKERKTVDTLREEVRRTAREVETLSAGLIRRIADRIEPDIVEGANAAVFEPIAKRLASLVNALEEVRTNVSKECERTDKVFEKQGQLLAESHAVQDADYRSFLEKSKEERSRATERTGTQARYNEIASHQRDLEARKVDRASRSKERQGLLKQLSELRDERFRARKAVAADLSRMLAGVIEVDVEQAGAAEGYGKLLAEALRNSSLKHNVIADRLEKAIRPGDLVRFVERADADRLAERGGIDLAKAQLVIDVLRGTERLYEIETVEIDDRPRIVLRDGDKQKESSALSTGQRCTAVLPILLLESERPLLIDQPEDNLDNKFIYETVVGSVLAAKGKRQLIFVTHNPNIPVLGNADRVFVMSSDGTQGKVAGAGTVDQLKGEIETLLEGGRKAFLLRKERYGH